MNIENMTLKDFDEIKDNLKEDFDEFWGASILKSELENENSKYIVAKESGEIVGFGGIWFSPVDAQITNIVVKKQARKRGIGSLLLEKLIEIAKQSEKDNISLEVNEKNIEAIKLYEKYNFKILGIRKNYYNGKENAIIMTKFFE